MIKKLKESYPEWKDSIPPLVFDITRDVINSGGSLYIVGGWPRDRLLGVHSPDLDFEVYGLNYDQLKEIVQGYGKANFVGKSFGVIHLKAGADEYDFALPRKESKIGVKHKDFHVEPDPNLSFEEASMRRDFTINSMGVKLPEIEIVDPNSGYEDLQKGILRHVSPAFSEDPLRVLRAVQFAARFEFDIADETIELCRGISLEHLSRERIFEEIKKLLLKSKKPSLGLTWMKELGVLKLFPELGNLIGVFQDPEWHPEGDVWTHNLGVLDAQAGLLSGDEGEDLVLMLAALCHDFGKAKTTKFENGKWRSPRHEDEGEQITIEFLSRITEEKVLIEEVTSLVRDHMKPWLLYRDRDKVKDSAIRRLSLRVDLKKLVKLAKADWLGKGDTDPEGEFLPGKWLIERSRDLEVLDSRPKPLLTGNILMSLGVKPGPIMGEIINECFESQLEGDIKTEDEAILWAKKKLKILK